MEPPTGSHIWVPASEWSDLKDTVREARQFSMEARDLGLANKQTLAEVVTPKLALVDDHERAINETNGALWAFGVIGALVALALATLPFLVR